MKTDNALFISVIVKEEEITVANSFNFQEAKENMIFVLGKVFDIKTDEGLIFKTEKMGESDVVFNYRAYINNEKETYVPPVKTNDNVKIFFDCPKCHNQTFNLEIDEDRDILVQCANLDCKHIEWVK
jgi:ssDNA-binding Zn-finger/Zn-ribbon topoisomerase 1